MPKLLEEIDFRDRTRALENLSRIAKDLPEGIVNRIHYLLASGPDPDSVLRGLEQMHQQHPAAFHRIARSTAGLQFLTTVFNYSRFLSEEVLKHPEWLDALPASGDLHRVLSAEELAEKAAPLPHKALSLALFRRQQILRILLRDVLGFATLSDVTEELSNLADAILHVAYTWLRTDLMERYGTPRFNDEQGIARECGFSVIALGKLGGRELNYSSDIDLMFVYSANGETSGPVQISNKEFFKKIANQYTDLLSSHTAEGFCYRVDLRLRPDGSDGEVCLSVSGAKQYYQTRGRDWELQMLIKARVAAGEREAGAELLDFVEPLTYSTTTDFTAVESVSLTRERINEKLAARRGQARDFDIKLARGGIRDIEFLVQCLQRLHGGREPWVRHGGTLLAISRLRDKDLLSPTEYWRLVSAYQFLRHLEHRLQFADDRQTHALPSEPDEVELLARCMPANEVGNVPSADQLLREVNAHLEEVQEIYERVIHAQRPMYYSTVTPPSGGGGEDLYLEPSTSNLIRFLDQRAPNLAASLARSTLRRGARHFEHFLEKVMPIPDRLALLDQDPVLAGYTIDLFEHSSYFAEQLIRNPEYLEELLRTRENPGGAPRYSEMVALLADAAGLRRYFRREMLRIQSESICLAVPIFNTLGRTSELADAVIAAAYRMAVEQEVQSRPPLDPRYTAKDQLMVISLGRLGMREFDLASDADLVFVLSDEDAREQLFWTHVAERMINLITAYTGEGVMFAVDTRLRPNGRAGALVQSEGSYKEYFATQAEAWEGITYMKARAVAGSMERSTLFLHELQQVDWRRYGQSGRSRKALRQMRIRLEKEQGASNPLKAGKGGYYDIDFALMFLRLKGAGIFYKVLNTPERIEVIEQMGHMERADAEFLVDAATFYRAVDHGLRVTTGQAEGSLPNSPSHRESVTELVTRWTPEHLHDQPIDVELAQIQARTREYFDRLFGS